MADDRMEEDFCGIQVRWGRFPRGRRPEAKVALLRGLFGLAGSLEMVSEDLPICAPDGRSITVFWLLIQGLRFNIWRFNDSDGILVERVVVSEQGSWGHAFLLGNDQRLSNGTIEMEALLILEPEEAVS